MQKIDLYEPIMNTRVGPVPLVLKIATTQNNAYIAGGVAENNIKLETYVLFSALPFDLQEKIKVAIQTLTSSV